MDYYKYHVTRRNSGSCGHTKKSSGSCLYCISAKSFLTHLQYRCNYLLVHIVVNNFTSYRSVAILLGLKTENFLLGSWPVSIDKN